MKNRFPVRVRPCVAALLCLVASTAAHAAKGGSDNGTAVSGKTSQKLPISFRISSREVKDLRYRIDDRCPRGKRLFVKAWGFPPLAIKNSRFGGKFVAKPPHDATATIAGVVKGKTVTGTLTDRSRNSKTHKICAGKATFVLTHQ